MLLLSATCRPVAVEAIKKSLKLEDSNVDIIRAELTRPEIRIVCIPMEGSMVSCHNLIKVFPSVNDVSNEDLVPTLVYSGSRNRTLTALEVISMARETPAESMNPSSTCARRYHSCTGDLDKNDCVEDFATGKVPIVSCTMALGLGQNWKRVRMVRDGQRVSVADTRYPLADTRQCQRIPANGCGWPLFRKKLAGIRVSQRIPAAGRGDGRLEGDPSSRPFRGRVSEDTRCGRRIPARGCGCGFGCSDGRKKQPDIRIRADIRMPISGDVVEMEDPV
ncbi:ATP-dependent DNA helicase sgs1 [Puccinia graminis f. sp. tritici]|uniref:DNA 3'-5' helicase n=1 Tax=Puccinia graminis f. sp. tritici TaxID=56615 RepID=A0A5B0RVR9_PUCGR|nr:ATP-dependent DNA helicase sgs1 [Puccinia graminis f. sp. tritici]